MTHAHHITTMVSQTYSHHDSSTTTSALFLTFSSDSLAIVSSYPPLSLHASTVVSVPILLALSCTLHLQSLPWMPPALWQWQKPWNLVRVLPCLQLHHLCLVHQRPTPPWPRPLVPTFHRNTHFPVYVVLTFSASIFLNQPWLFKEQEHYHYCVLCLSGGTSPQDDFLTR